MNMSFFKLLNISENSKKRKPFILTVPNLDDFENPRTIINPSELKDWLNDLPLANQNVAIKDILTEIQLINRYPKKLPPRKKLIEKFEHSHKVLFLIVLLPSSYIITTYVYYYHLFVAMIIAQKSRLGQQMFSGALKRHLSSP